MTETGMNASNLIDPTQRKAKSVGYPLAGVTVREVGDDGVDVPTGDVGEVWIRGDNVFRGKKGMNRIHGRYNGRYSSTARESCMIMMIVAPNLCESLERLLPAMLS